MLFNAIDCNVDDKQILSYLDTINENQFKLIVFQSNFSFIFLSKTIMQLNKYDHVGDDCIHKLKQM